MAAMAVITTASISAMSVSVAYQLGRVMISQAVARATNLAISLLETKSGSVGKVQFILMELDLEAKFKCVRQLLKAIKEDQVEMEKSSRGYILQCVQEVDNSITTALMTLRRIQDDMDAHIKLWFHTRRTLDVSDDLELLSAQSKNFDKRVQTLIQCLSVPAKVEQDSFIPMCQQSLQSQLVFEDLNGEKERQLLERAEARALASRAMQDAGEDVVNETVESTPKTTVLFEDPVFL